MSECVKIGFSINKIEFANIIQSLPKVLTQFKGRSTVNKYQIVIEEIFASKYQNVKFNWEENSCKIVQEKKHDSASI